LAVVAALPCGENEGAHGRVKRLIMHFFGESFDGFLVPWKGNAPEAVEVMAMQSRLNALAAALSNRVQRTDRNVVGLGISQRRACDQ
jgi:hypothetical protein